MQLRNAAALLALAPAVMGWKIELWSEEDCSEYDQGDSGKMIIEGSGSLPYCIGPGGYEFPEGVRCQFYGNNGKDDGVDCTGQFETVKSFYVHTGNFITWEWFDSTQDNSAMCSDRILYENQANGPGGEYSVFKSEDRCRNAWWQTKDYWTGIHRWEEYFQGISAWDV